MSLTPFYKKTQLSYRLRETEKRNPEFDTLDELLSLLDVSYDYLTGKTDEEGHNTTSEESLKQIAAWTIVDDTYDKIKKYLALDVYGASAIDDLIAAEYKRCREQQTLTDTSDYDINISFKPDKIQV